MRIWQGYLHQRNDMRELVLNDASIAAADQRTAMDWLVDIAKKPF